MTVRPAHPEDFDEIIALERKAFPSVPEEMIRSFAFNDPWGRLEHTRVAEIDGELASIVRIVKRPIRLGGVTVWLGGISGVGTLPKHRGKGCASACLRDALDYMKRHSMPVSMLFCVINEFYARLGFQTLPVTRYSVALEGVPEAAPEEFSIRQASWERDLEAVADIFERFNQGRGTAVVRSHEYWRAWTTWAIWDAYVYETPEAFLIAQCDGAAVAYSRSKLVPKGEKQAELLELCCLPGAEGASLGLFARTCALARERGFTELGFFSPEDHPLLERLHSVGVQLEQSESTAMMWRVVDLAALLECLLPNLSHFCKVNGQWCLSVNDQVVGLRCTYGNVRLAEPSGDVVQMGPATLIALLTRRHLPDTDETRNLYENHPDLLSVLNIGQHFPAPVYYRADEF